MRKKADKALMRLYFSARAAIGLPAGVADAGLFEMERQDATSAG
jgi:hypothetical protein